MYWTRYKRIGFYYSRDKANESLWIVFKKGIKDRFNAKNSLVFRLLGHVDQRGLLRDLKMTKQTEVAKEIRGRQWSQKSQKSWEGLKYLQTSTHDVRD